MHLNGVNGMLTGGAQMRVKRGAVVIQVAQYGVGCGAERLVEALAMGDDCIDRAVCRAIKRLGETIRVVGQSLGGFLNGGLQPGLHVRGKFAHVGGSVICRLAEMVSQRAGVAHQLAMNMAVMLVNQRSESLTGSIENLMGSGGFVGDQSGDAVSGFIQRGGGMIAGLGQALGKRLTLDADNIMQMLAGGGKTLGQGVAVRGNIAGDRVTGGGEANVEIFAHIGQLSENIGA